MKTGDKLICKKNFIINNKKYFLKGHEYIIHQYMDFTKNLYVQYSDEINKYDGYFGNWFSADKNNIKMYNNYLYDFFYTESEIRKKKINTIIK